ncbi:peptidyl-glycine alpha-amidating monooxygenase A-like isoform X2 [Haliotis rufescens]|uniref:peptidyl-glycine alpha-amidating monooxygenase A-like isoform X2 n=1 Tax=Haliotis rufescens TaxID=6454 RepID=UPI00201EA8CD|nr:peptidyl-glycine alpha-amidating monooxygenase A-like isoform X2 [Haliotis rufescens]
MAHRWMTLFLMVAHLQNISPGDTQTTCGGDEVSVRVGQSTRTIDLRMRGATPTTADAYMGYRPMLSYVTSRCLHVLQADAYMYYRPMLTCVKGRCLHVLQADAYMCSSFNVANCPEDTYIVKFEALTSGSVAHHISLKACNGKPLGQTDVWNCRGDKCRSGQRKYLYAWAKHATSTSLPKGVGFRIGKGSTITTLILQIHYKHGFTDSTKKDYSGIRLTVSTKRELYSAGMEVMYLNGFRIPPQTPKVLVNISCSYTGDTPIYPFAFRTHAHNLGRAITSYLYNGSWYEIGKGNPMWPQVFYPVQRNIVIKPGDKLVARCLFDSTDRNRSTYAGYADSDEMCNFIIMFKAEANTKSLFPFCGGNTYPDLVRKLPPDSAVPLPRNPLLEEEAQGHDHHHIHVPPPDNESTAGNRSAVDAELSHVAENRSRETTEDGMDTILTDVFIISGMMLVLGFAVVLAIYQSGKISKFCTKTRLHLPSFLGNTYRGFDRLDTEEKD